MITPKQAATVFICTLRALQNSHECTTGIVSELFNRCAKLTDSPISFACELKNSADLSCQFIDRLIEATQYPHQ